VKVHLDDGPENPYYTIAMDGEEKQTVRGRLKPLASTDHTQHHKHHTTTISGRKAGRRAAQCKHDSHATKALLKLAHMSHDAADLFKTLDKNGERCLTAKKLNEHFVTTDNGFGKLLLKAMDTDGDGVVDEQEFIAAHNWATQMRADIRAFYDAGIGTGGPAQMFGEIDVDGDGAITKREVTKYMKKLTHHAAFDPEHQAEVLFHAIDTDGDGLIDKKEFTEAHKRAREYAIAMPAPPPPKRRRR